MADAAERGRVEIVRKAFRIVLERDDPHIYVQTAGFTQPLIPSIGIDTADGIDRRISVRRDSVSTDGGIARITWIERSTQWSKRVYLDVHPDHMLFHADVEGAGAVDTIRYFDVIEDAGFVEHFVVTKHFNDKSQTHPRAYSTGSPTRFRHVLCPEPNSHARQVFAPFEYAQVSVNADLDYCGGNFIANPGLLAFAIADDPDRDWLALGLAVEPGQHAFSEFEYLGGRTFALGVNCWRVPRTDDHFRPPAVVIAPGRDADHALGGYVQVLTDRGLVSSAPRRGPDWWQRPIVGGWGHQCYQADLFRIRSGSERRPDNAAYTLSTQATYRDIVEILDGHELPWGTLVIDARWFLSGGLKNVDIGRWPDLRGFIDALHRRGRRVVLWWSPWDAEDVPAQDCIRYLPGDGDRQNRPGRLSKFGIPTPGKKLAVDITLPQVQDRIREQIRIALGSEPGCYNADGLKIDHVSAAPGIYGMSFPADSGRLFGVEAAHEALALIYDAAKTVKADALVLGQSPNPYFADVQDVVRLGDIYARQADSVVEEMQFRARMARIAAPGAPVDADGWPMPSLQAWREYVREQPRLGVPSLYYATHLDTTGEVFTADDYALIRSSWRDL